MESALIVLSQTLTMSIYLLIGFALYKGGKISREGSKSLANLLVWLVIPAVIIHSFCVEFSLEKLQDLGLSALLAAGALLIAILTARLLFGKNAVDCFAVSFSNCGFMGIPLVKAGFGDGAVFLLVGFIVLLNLLQWTYGASLLKGERKRLTLKELLLNPIMIGSILGLLLFVTGLGTKLPVILSGAISGVAALNSPIAMLVLGIYMAQASLKETFLSPRLYCLSGVRLLLMLIFIPASPMMKYVILIGAAAPVGANVAVYAQLYDKDYSYACQTVVVSTLLSIATLPVMTALAGLAW